MDDGGLYATHPLGRKSQLETYLASSRPKQAIAAL